MVTQSGKKVDKCICVSPNDNRFYFTMNGTLYNVTEQVNIILSNERVSVCSALRTFITENNVSSDDVKQLALMQFIDKLEKGGKVNGKN